MPNSLLMHSYNLGLLALLFFVIGMAKPQWALFFMKKPSRWVVTMVSTVLFMIVMTMHGEGSREAKRAAKHAKATEAGAVPVPVPEAVPVPVPKDNPKETAKKK